MDSSHLDGIAVPARVGRSRQYSDVFRRMDYPGNAEDILRSEYSADLIRSGVRGNYAARYRENIAIEPKLHRLMGYRLNCGFSVGGIGLVFRAPAVRIFTDFLVSRPRRLGVSLALTCLQGYDGSVSAWS